MTLVGQDWSRLIGLRLAAEHPGRFSRIVVANTGLPTGDFPMPDIWWAFRKAIQGQPAFQVSSFVQGRPIERCGPRCPPVRRRCWWRDPIAGAMAAIFEQSMLGAQGIDHPLLQGAGHFIQEDGGEELAGHIVDFLSRSGAPEDGAS